MEGGDAEQDVKIHLKGDVDGNGKITLKDINAVCDHISKVTLLTGYELSCADVSGDDKVTLKDLNKLIDHFSKVEMLW